MSRANETKFPGNISLPKIGNRVKIPGHEGTFVVVSINEERASVSLLPERDPLNAATDKVICLRPPQ
jgi:hypothetical protein